MGLFVPFFFYSTFIAKTQFHLLLCLSVDSSSWPKTARSGSGSRGDKTPDDSSRHLITSQRESKTSRSEGLQQIRRQNRTFLFENDFGPLLDLWSSNGVKTQKAHTHRVSQGIDTSANTGGFYSVTFSMKMKVKVIFLCKRPEERLETPGEDVKMWTVHQTAGTPGFPRVCVCVCVYLQHNHTKQLQINLLLPFSDQQPKHFYQQ